MINHEHNLQHHLFCFQIHHQKVMNIFYQIAILKQHEVNHQSKNLKQKKKGKKKIN